MAILEAKGSEPQARFCNHSAKFPAFVGGFGSGKTHALILRSLSLVFGSGRDIAFYMPTYGLIKDVLYPRYTEMLRGARIPYKLNAGDHTLSINGKRILFRSLDNPDRIIGYEVGDSLVDELDTLAKDKARRAWQMVIARNRQQKPGINTACVGTTPEGFRFVYEQWKKARSDSYQIVTAPTYSNPHLPEDYVQSLRDTYDERLLEAYLEGRFVNLTSGNVYHSYDRHAHGSDEEVDGPEPLFIGMDFNVTRQAATVYVRRDQGGLDVWHAVDEFCDVFDTPAMIRAINGKYPGNRKIIYPDATGKGRNTTDATVSDISLLESAGFRIRANSRNPAVRDRVNAMNAAFERGELKINEARCPRTAECLEQQAWRNGEPDKTSDFDHQNDATGYPIAYEKPIRRPVADINVRFAV